MANRLEDLSLVGAAGFDIDDDNAPLPENVPQENEGVEDGGEQQRHDWG